MLVSLLTAARFHSNFEFSMIGYRASLTLTSNSPLVVA